MNEQQNKIANTYVKELDQAKEDYLDEKFDALELNNRIAIARHKFETAWRQSLQKL